MAGEGEFGGEGEGNVERTILSVSALLMSLSMLHVSSLLLALRPTRPSLTERC